MSIWALIIREIAYRKLNFARGLVGVAGAVGLLIGVLTCLHLHDARSEEIVARKQAETRATMAALKVDVKRAMHRLGYNATVLPKDQSLGDWYAQDYASRTMPESWASRLADTKDLVDRYLPRLRQKLTWDEKQWTIIVVGVGNERVLGTSACEAATLVDTIPRGSCVVGYELHDALTLGDGDEIAIRGRTFRVSKCAEESGTKDDITIWLNLADAQKLVGKPDLINEILLVEHISVWGKLKEVRRRVEDILPECQVVEIASETLSRAHARIKVANEAEAAVAREQEKRALLRQERISAVMILVPLGVLLCACWVGLLMYHNVRDRALEIGSLLAVGFRVGQLRKLLVSKAVLLGMAGGLLGFTSGTGVAAFLGIKDQAGVGIRIGLGTALTYFVVAQIVGILACLLGSWLPAQAAVATDPAEVLRGE
jgi:putative ABC transport system permease protein